MASRSWRLATLSLFLMLICTALAITIMWSYRREAYFQYIDQHGNPFEGKVYDIRLRLPFLDAPAAQYDWSRTSNTLHYRCLIAACFFGARGCPIKTSLAFLVAPRLV